MLTYSEKLKDPRWQRKRLVIFDRDSFACLLCGRTDETLHIHHGYYAARRDPWDYEDETLWTLCETCHNKVTQLQDDLRLAIGLCHPGCYHAILAVIRAHIAKPQIMDEGF
jgi:5-methylcytosine-specific restriction endonuclease McrA